MDEGGGVRLDSPEHDLNKVRDEGLHPIHATRWMGFVFVTTEQSPLVRPSGRRVMRNLKENQGHKGQPPRRLEFVMVRTENLRFHLTREEGARLVARLERWWAPRFVTFTDLHGSVVTLSTSAIREIFDTGPASRFSEQVFNRALMREDQRFNETLETQDGE